MGLPFQTVFFLISHVVGIFKPDYNIFMNEWYEPQGKTLDPFSRASHGEPAWQVGRLTPIAPPLPLPLKGREREGLKIKSGQIFFHYLIFLFPVFFGIFSGFSQTGRILLVGGGNEKNNAAGWSTPSYRWAGEGKRVAIIGTSTGTLAQYFIQQCNAASAKEFAIASHDSANSEATYDTLISYDVIFFRGGDQYDYYVFYRNTRLLDAVNYVYNHGGTICGTSAGMHILSPILFTAKYGSAYPDECIENPNNSYVTLANDFLDFFSGIIFDTHFAERGRFGRLAGFLANYKFNKGQSITGLGLDDMTCMRVDETGLGTVYGTGCANIYLAGSGYSLHGTKLLADTIRVIQLLQGCTYHFLTGEIGYSSLDHQINTSALQESGNYTLLASGSDLLADNLAMLTDFVQTTGSPSSRILLLSGDQTLAASFSAKMVELGAGQVDLYKPDLLSGSDIELENQIRHAKKIIFLKNSYTDFSAFLGTANGELLQQRVKIDTVITSFVGDNARFAGKAVIENYLTEYASYYGELTFGKGLSLLSNTVIMPNTYVSSDMYENSVTAVPYVMLRDSLKYGIWLTNHNYMKYMPVAGKAILTGYGTAPVMVIANAGTLAGFSTHTATGTPSPPPRMIAGFEKLQFSLIDDTTPYKMGSILPSGIPTLKDEFGLVLSPNPVRNKMTLSYRMNDFNWSLINLPGGEIMRGKASGSFVQIDVSQLRPGFYLVRINGDYSGYSHYAKFLKE